MLSLQPQDRLGSNLVCSSENVVLHRYVDAPLHKSSSQSAIDTELGLLSAEIQSFQIKDPEIVTPSPESLSSNKRAFLANTLQPISRLPDDILILIFTAYVYSSLDDGLGTLAQIITFVCRRWASAATSCPALWTRVSVLGDRPPASLTAHLKTASRWLIDIEIGPGMGTFKHAAQVGTYAARICSITIAPSYALDHVLKALIGGVPGAVDPDSLAEHDPTDSDFGPGPVLRYPFLHTLSITGPDPHFWDPEWFFDARTAPALTSLTLANLLLWRTTLPTHPPSSGLALGITSLTLSNAPNGGPLSATEITTHHLFLATLSAFPCLRTLHMVGVVVSITPLIRDPRDDDVSARLRSGEGMVLPHIKELRITGLFKKEVDVGMAGLLFGWLSHLEKIVLGDEETAWYAVRALAEQGETMLESLGCLVLLGAWGWAETRKDVRAWVQKRKEAGMRVPCVEVLWMYELERDWERGDITRL
ncbi:hypothetical protein HYDPIDRAFT_33001 [Hydnomerulius pinastri MD-312]|uniref:F-box domain-containing protein n=1 Tax=Hydnomerulius pinastri MD-312 TaxID=994086 RepID=A0A0C9W1B5_9AGAM|nr:hypothetical protein HYDPIDRAFT_33001 [Hydnomerulius pinastri MD-312]